MESAIGPGFCCDDNEASSQGGICCLNSTLYNLPQVQIECSQTSSWESCESMWIICHFVGLQRVYTWGWGWYFRIPIQSYTSIGCIDYRLRLRFSTGDIDIVVKETLGGASEQTVGEGLSSKPWKGKPHLTHIKITSPSFTSASLWKL